MFGVYDMNNAKRAVKSGQPVPQLHEIDMVVDMFHPF